MLCRTKLRDRRLNNVFGSVRLSLTEMVLMRNGVRRCSREVMQARLGLEVGICSGVLQHLLVQEGR